MLPIDQYLPEINQIFSQKGDSTLPINLVLQAEPGAGKSTRVPLHLLSADFLCGKKILMLEPRRVAVKSIAYYLALQLGEKVGQRIGYQIRNERVCSAATQLEIVTEGILTKRLQHDPELSDVGLIIFDEFHERSIHADLALMLSLEVQQAYRPDLKLLVMSATIDTEAIADYIASAHIVKCEGKTYPVSLSYQENKTQYLAQKVLNALDSVIHQESSGDILVFLPGQGDIKKCLSLAQEKYLHRQAETPITLLALYGALPLEQQEKVLIRKNTSNKRVIFSTNIAQTSLTIEGIATIIDSGLEKSMVYDVKSGLSRLATQRISKASATQRAGRAGRLQAGHCIRLWSESAQTSMNQYDEEEIVSADLSSLVLDLSAWGVTQFEEANWLTPPPKLHFSVASELLNTLGLVNPENKITELGHKALSLGLDPRLASMMLKCESKNERKIAIVIAALLSERELLIQHHNCDITDRVSAVFDVMNKKNQPSSAQSFVQAPVKVNRAVMEQVNKLIRSFAKALNVNMQEGFVDVSLLGTEISTVLLKAFPERLAKSRGNNNKYQLANGRGVVLDETDGLHGTPWLVVSDCDGQNKDGRIYSCAPISQTALVTELATEIYSKTIYSLDAKKEKVVGKEISKYMTLVIEEKLINDIPSAEFHRCIIDIINQQGLHFLNWNKPCQEWLARVSWLGAASAAFPQITTQWLLANINNWLMPYVANVKSIKQLKALSIYDLLVANLTWEQQQQLNQQAPVNYITPSDKKVVIRYDENQGPTVSVALQEMFGQLTTPMLANGTVALRFELLSPARRPIQTTSDLANFWLTSYFDVAKDMRGKYPKHRWPEKPLEEKAGHSRKRR